MLICTYFKDGDLEYLIKVTILVINNPFCVPMLLYIKFGQNASYGLRDSVQPSVLVKDNIFNVLV